MASQNLKRMGQKIFRNLSLLFEIRIWPGRGKEKDRYNSYQKRYINFGKYIKKGDKVLDIGSGQHPFPLATHLADFSEKETSHRAGELVKDERPLTICNIESMPFKDKEFDFVFCSHVLEHVKNPAKACEEIMRIGKKGYIETPTRTSDTVFNIEKGQRHHRWYINMAGNTLIFIEYPERERRDTEFTYIAEQFQSFLKNPIQDFIYNNRDLFVNMFLWEDKFNYYVFDKNGNLILSKIYV